MATSRSTTPFFINDEFWMEMNAND
ncbi:uncharacterized protein G2W53_032362 [Senna tora]|uniref:Uncharacterized protein n=1 Tax=Senna tora TaxID=362788 RepID=A0A834WA68_9FABA|nr:uncharacterized protein G2W53_032362 [Senna tora]